VTGAAWCRQLVARTALCAVALSAGAFALPVAPSSAQGLFDFFWGNRGSDRGNGGWNERGYERWNERGRDNGNERSNNGWNDRSSDKATDAPSRRSTTESIRKRLRAPTSPREERDSAPVVTGGASVAYCVRLCDGRYFPIQRSGAEPADICNAFCPAAKTKIYLGTAIEYAVANDGKRYSTLDTAFTYRQKVVDGCTCNGKDSFGLARLDLSKDPTLRAGDIVARDGTLMAFKGSKKSTYTADDFTPIQTYAKSDNSLRKRLSNVKVAPPTTANLSASQSQANASAEPQASQQPDRGRRRNQPSR
jgi:uncharacterized protein DUF2865